MQRFCPVNIQYTQENGADQKDNKTRYGEILDETKGFDPFVRISCFDGISRTQDGSHDDIQISWPEPGFDQSMSIKPRS
jgi:hypothetical protein